MKPHEKLLPNQPNQSHLHSLEEVIYNFVENFSTPMEFKDGTDFGEVYMGSPMPELRLIDFLCQMIPIENALEIGTYYGLATMRIAHHAKRVVTIENHPNAIAMSKRNFYLNGFDNIQIVEENADDYIHTIQQCRLYHDKEVCLDSFDFIFVDGKKENYPLYFNELVHHLRPKGIMVFDDVLFHGDVFNSMHQTKKGEGVRDFLELSKSFEGFRMLLPLGNGVLVMVKK